MSLITLVNWSAAGIAIAGALAVWLGQTYRPLVLKSRRAVTVFGAVWIAVLLVEFYALGPASFISMNIDGNVGTTFFTFLTQRHLGGQIAHAYGGGHDIDTVLGFGTQYFSLERILFSVLPAWLANLVLKIAVAGGGFAGAYKLCRAAGPYGRTLAAALAALFTVALHYNINATTWNGLGYAVLPWVIYLGVAREGRRAYLPGLFLLGLMAAMTEPLHTFLSIAAAALTAVVVLGKINLRTLILPMAVTVLVMLVNWHEVFYALKQIAPLTIRGRVNFGDVSFLESLSRALQNFTNLGIAPAFIVLSALALAIKRDRFVWNALAAIGVMLGCYVALAWLPWHWIGLDVVKGLSPHYLYFANAAIAVPIGARAVLVLSKPDKAWPTAFVFAVAVGAMLQFKVGNLVNLAYYGGQSQYSTFDNLAAPDWLGKEAVRVVTLRHQQPEPELLAAFYGLDTYDGTLNLTPAAYTLYWRHGILKSQTDEGIFGRLTMYRRFSRDASYDVRGQADLGFLRIANVGFIISPVPLDGGLKLVSGPDHPPVRRADGLGRFARDRWARIFHAGKVYVYSLGAPLPRAFAARSIHRVAEDTPDKAFLLIVAGAAPQRGIVIRGDKAFNSLPDLSTLQVTSLSKTQDGYDATVTAPSGGLLVLNVPPMPFWEALNEDGKRLPVTPVNMVHMAVTVPPGTKKVSFRYHRPTLRELF